MNTISFSWMTCLYGLGIGFALCIIYTWLLWLTVKKLTHVQHKGLFLLGSAVVRILLFIIPAIYLSQHDVSCFLFIVIGFILSRFIIVSQVKTSSKGGK